MTELFSQAVICPKEVVSPAATIVPLSTICNSPAEAVKAYTFPVFVPVTELACVAPTKS